MKPEKLAPPEATYTRAAYALRKLASRVDLANTAGIVLVSDGRCRSSESVEQLASYLGGRGIPIHVVPVGSVEGSFNIAIVSIVAPASVREIPLRKRGRSFRPWPFLEFE